MGNGPSAEEVKLQTRREENRRREVELKKKREENRHNINNQLIGLYERAATRDAVSAKSIAADILALKTTDVGTERERQIAFIVTALQALNEPMTTRFLLQLGVDNETFEELNANGNGLIVGR